MERASHQTTPTAAIPASGDERDDGQRRVAAGQGRGRTQEVVVPGAVVDVADRGRWAEERHDAVLHEEPKDEHVVALVASQVPRVTRFGRRMTARRASRQRATRRAT